MEPDENRSETPQELEGVFGVRLEVSIPAEKKRISIAEPQSLSVSVIFSDLSLLKEDPLPRSLV